MAVSGHLCGSGYSSGRFACSWTLEDVGSLTSQAGRNAISERFEPPENSIGEFYLILFTEEQSAAERSVAVFLGKGQERWPNQDTFYLKVDGAFESPRGKTITSTKNDYRVFPAAPESSSDLVCFIERDVLLKELEKDTLVVSVEVTYSVSIVKNTQGEAMFVGESCPILSLSQSLLSGFETERCSDVVVSVKGTDLPAHRIVLASRSKVFAAMLENSHRIDVSDFEVDSVKQLLRFLYSGRVDGVTESIALKLLRASQRYGVEDLKQFCSNYLLSVMDASNVLSILVVASLYGAEELRKQALAFFERYCVYGD